MKHNRLTDFKEKTIELVENKNQDFIVFVETDLNCKCFLLRFYKTGVFGMFLFLYVYAVTCIWLRQHHFPPNDEKNAQLTVIRLQCIFFYINNSKKMEFDV